MAPVTQKLGLRDPTIEKYVNIRIVSRSVYLGRKNSGRLFGITYLCLLVCDKLICCCLSLLSHLKECQVFCFVVFVLRMSVLFKQPVYNTHFSCIKCSVQTDPVHSHTVAPFEKVKPRK